ncbi:MAG: transposase [Planctomycetaceae bacterium]|jgi:putative transposase|nr:transposase [Planctomycetaceae bacterium]MBV8606911.1 transposase [Singulisphaera sp.]MBV8231034.1 transposase [Planctomycetaceae bacterium]MBV8267897.1 transposase [Planctomycetaceae bacterium]MBV8315106.1 transposase [Planctomycetaceae bacterium]
MNTPRCTDESYIQFLIASPGPVSCTEAARVQPDSPFAPAHDSFTRLLNRLEPDPETLWQEAEPLVETNRGVLVIDDSTNDKPYAKHIGLVTRHWSGKHKKPVRGINLITLLWTDGDCKIPCDYRLYSKADGKTKNDHFWEMMLMAKGRGFSPRCVLFDGWYASLENLKQVRDFGWTWLTRLKGNRTVTPGDRRSRTLDEVAVSSLGTLLHLKGYGMIKVFRIDARDGDAEYWATNDPGMDESVRREHAELGFQIENYHRDLKQFCGVEKCQVRSARAQRNHIGMALRAFLRLEWHFFTTGVSAFHAKFGLVRDAVRRYLARPSFTLPGQATA